MTDTIRFDIPQSAIPTQWYNVQADLPRSTAACAASRHASTGGAG